jgi:hypothetical protein
MCVFAVILSHSQQQLAKYSFNFFNLFRAFIGLFAIVLGALWLL